MLSKYCIRVSCAILLSMASLVYAQETVNEQIEPSTATLPQAQQNLAQAPIDISNQITQNSEGVLRLEQTIRANKEQPQVLTIVPWQLPTHQRIDESRAWQPVVQQLPNIERGQFLRDLAVVDDILAIKATGAEKNERP